MSKRTEIATTRVGPTYLQEWTEEDRSLEDLREYRVLSRVKVVQNLSSPDLKKEFGIGSIILSPVNQLLADAENPFLFVPLFFYTEFIVWNDRLDTGSPAIFGRTFDKGSDFAHRARTESKRFEGYGPPGPKGEAHVYQRRYTENLTFPGIVYGEHPLRGTPCSLVFSRGEFFTGKNFVSSIMMRKVGSATAPLWSQVWEFRSAERNRNNNQWWGVDFGAPTVGEPYIAEEEVEPMRTLNHEFHEAFNAQRLTVDMSDADEQDLTELT